MAEIKKFDQKICFFPSRDWSMIWIANEGNFVVEIDKDQDLYHSFW